MKIKVDMICSLLSVAQNVIRESESFNFDFYQNLLDLSFYLSNREK